MASCNDGPGSKDHDISSLEKPERQAPHQHSKCDKHYDENVCFYCKVCRIPVCTACLVLNHQGHKLEELEDLSCKTDNRDVVNCTVHGGKLHYYCNDCQELICSHCLTITHKHHEAIDSCDRAKELEKSFNEVNKTKQSIIKDPAKEMIEQIRILKQNHQKNYTDIKEELNDLFEKLEEKMNIKREKCFRYIETANKENLSKIEICEAEIQEEVLEFEKKHTEVEEEKSQLSEIELVRDGPSILEDYRGSGPQENWIQSLQRHLSWLHKSGLIFDLGELEENIDSIKFVLQNARVMVKENSKLHFGRDQVFSLISKDGNIVAAGGASVEVYDKKSHEHIRYLSKDKIRAVDVIKVNADGDISDGVVSNGDVRDGDVTDRDVSDGNASVFDSISGNGYRQRIEYAIASKTSVKIYDDNWIHIKDIPMKFDDIVNIAVNGNKHIAVVERNKKNVRIVDLDGNTRLTLDGMVAPCDVIVNRDSEYIILDAESKLIRVFGSTGRLRRQWKHPSFGSVLDGKALAIDKYGHVFAKGYDHVNNSHNVIAYNWNGDDRYNVLRLEKETNVLCVDTDNDTLLVGTEPSGKPKRTEVIRYRLIRDFLERQPDMKIEAEEAETSQATSQFFREN